MLLTFVLLTFVLITFVLITFVLHSFVLNFALSGTGYKYTRTDMARLQKEQRVLHQMQVRDL